MAGKWERKAIGLARKPRPPVLPAVSSCLLWPRAQQVLQTLWSGHPWPEPHDECTG